MNWDQVEGKWKQIKGEAKTRWGKLTDDDLDTVAGQRDKLVGTVQERYGIAKDQAQREVEDFIAFKKAQSRQDPKDNEAAE